MSNWDFMDMFVHEELHREVRIFCVIQALTASVQPEFDASQWNMCADRMINEQLQNCSEVGTYDTDTIHS
jgi:hypothetical protein